MGMRSQIYIAYTDEKGNNRLVARYYGWNFGARMVSRARGIIDWILRKGLAYPFHKDWEENLIRIADTNFDIKDCVISSDILEEAREFYFYRCYSPEKFIFEGEPNNDGKLFIIIQDNTIKYAFTDSDITKPLSAEKYMTWGEYQTEEESGSNYKSNCKFIKDNAELMTDGELRMFMSAHYSNIHRIKINESDKEFTLEVVESIRHEMRIPAATEEEAIEAASQLWSGKKDVSVHVVSGSF